MASRSHCDADELDEVNDLRRALGMPPVDRLDAPADSTISALYDHVLPGAGRFIEAEAPPPGRVGTGEGRSRGDAAAGEPRWAGAFVAIVLAALALASLVLRRPTGPTPPRPTPPPAAAVAETGEPGRVLE